MATIEELRWVPKGSTKMAHKETGAVVYVYEAVGHPGAKFGLVGYAPKARKPTFHFVFKTEMKRELHAFEFFRKHKAHKDRIATERAEAAAFKHSIQVGHVFACSWGYEQTNVDFYQVTRLVGRTGVMIRRIASVQTSSDGPHGMSGRVVPEIGSFTGEEMLKRVHQGNRITISSFSSAYLWEGRPMYVSWYA